MDTAVEFFLFILGLALLLGGAELFVMSALGLAKLTGGSRLLIGMTIVAFGTSAPELAIGVIGVLEQHADIGLGNIIGSNIFNILFVLGLASLISPLYVDLRVILRDIPILFGISVTFFLMTLDHAIHNYEAIILFAILAGYFVYLFRYSSERSNVIAPELKEPEAEPFTAMMLAKKSVFILIAIAMLTIGSHWLVSGTARIAANFGISELVISLTLVALGTSLPEIATSVVAVRKKEYEMLFGNIIGSCIFNIIAVPVAMALLYSEPLSIDSEIINLDLPVMMVSVIACLPIFISDRRMSRFEGILFLVYYFAYIFVLYLKEFSGSILTEYKTIILTLIVPMTAITLVVVTYRAIRYRRDLKED